MSADIKTILAQKGLDGCPEGYPEVFDAVTHEQVRRRLAEPPGRYSLERLIELLSPAATDFLEQMAQQARLVTIQRFGQAIQLYAPLYVSNYCINSCVYCGFNRRSWFQRVRLSIEQAIADADVLASEGFRHLLLVSGEDPDFVSVEYLCELAEKLRPKFSSISAEIYPMTAGQYSRLRQSGIDGITLYQETYNRRAYGRYHPDGPKSNYDYRLESAQRFASAGMRRIGLGVLLGLGDWRCDTLALAEHACWIMKRYWRSQVSFSFPRIRPAMNVRCNFEHLVSDRQMVQMMVAIRLCFADTGVVLSTRESSRLRDNLVGLCVTSMSAGSKTSPGGYSGRTQTAGQFEINDDRTPAQIAMMIRSHGLEPVWKDWDAAFTQ